MLKHSIYNLESPIVLFDPEQPPYVPNVRVHPSVQHLLPVITGLVANKISLKARENPVRTYHFNECSFNNWQNSEFADTVKFTADILAVRLSIYVNTPFDQVLEESIVEALVLWTSRKVFEIPELDAAITPMLRNAANNNMRLYQNRMADADKLYDSIDPNPMPRIKTPKPEQPPINPNEIYQQPYPEDHDMTGIPNAYPRNAPGYNRPPFQQQTNPNGFCPGYDPQIRAGQYPNQRFPQQNQQMYPNQQPMNMGQNINPGMPQQQMYPNQQFMQPGMPQQQMYPNQQFMQPGMPQQQMYPNQQFMQPGMMYPNQQFTQPGMPQQQMYPGMMGSQQVPYIGLSSNFQAPGYPRGFIPYNSNFAAPQNGQNRTFQQANYHHNPVTQNIGLTENLSGARYNTPAQQPNQQFNQQTQQRFQQPNQQFNQQPQQFQQPVNQVNPRSPVDQGSFFDPNNQPHRRRPMPAHMAPEFADDVVRAPRHNNEVTMTITKEQQRRELEADFKRFKAEKDSDDNPWSYDNAVEKVTVKEWRPSDGQPYLQMINPLIEREEFHRIRDKVRQVVIPLENPVKREQHTIKMLGDTYQLDGVISNKRMERLEAAADNLLKISGVDVGNAEEKPDEKVMSDKNPDVEVKHYIDPGRIIDFFPDQALFEAALRFHEYNLDNKENHTNAYRCYMAVNKPIIINDDYHDFIHELRQTRSFQDLSKRIMSQSEAVYKSEKGLNYLPFIGVLVKINEMMTKMVNDCLKYELTLPEVSIDSFIDDVNDLPEFLENRYSAKYRKAFQEWERNIMQRLFVYQDKPENLKARLLDEKQIEAGINAVFIPETYSATFISATLAELNLNFGKKETLLLNKKGQKVLFTIAQSLFWQKDGGARDSVVDYVITADNVKLRIYRGYLGDEAYLVSKA